jgi:ParB/RepB/Spo0J family partition protein
MVQRRNEPEEIFEIPLSDIRVSDENVRHERADAELDDLAESIKKHGLLQPVVLRGNRTDRPPYELIVGQRRYKAHQKLKKRTIRAVFVGSMDDTQAMLRSLAENMHRVELTYEDAANAVTHLYRHFERDEAKVASETGMSLRRVRQYIYIEERASEETRQKLRDGKVSPVDAERALQAAGGDSAKADELLRFVEESKPTTYEKKRMVEYGAANPKASAKSVIKEALKPKLERTIVVNLPQEVREALSRAAGKLNLSDEEVASRALIEWLLNKGFLNGWRRT